MTNICDILPKELDERYEHCCKNLIPEEYNSCIEILKEYSYFVRYKDDRIKILYSSIKMLIDFHENNHIHMESCTYCLMKLYKFLSKIQHIMLGPFAPLDNSYYLHEIDELYVKISEQIKNCKLFETNIFKINNETLNTIRHTVENFNEEYVMKNQRLKEIYIRECKKMNLC